MNESEIVFGLLMFALFLVIGANILVAVGVLK